ncbi:hypothetical protein JCM13991_08720 [Thermodesulfovibrio hydrogeniphilus]
MSFKSIRNEIASGTSCPRNDEGEGSLRACRQAFLPSLRASEGGESVSKARLLLLTFVEARNDGKAVKARNSGKDVEARNDEKKGVESRNDDLTKVL